MESSISLWEIVPKIGEINKLSKCIDVFESIEKYDIDWHVGGALSQYDRLTLRTTRSQFHPLYIRRYDQAIAEYFLLVRNDVSGLEHVQIADLLNRNVVRVSDYVNSQYISGVDLANDLKRLARNCAIEESIRLLEEQEMSQCDNR